VEPPPHSHSGPKDLLLVNPSAGGSRAAGILPALRKFAEGHHWNIDIRVTTSLRDLEAIARQAAEARFVERIFVLGGDGTFQALLNAVAAYPEIVLGVIPAGDGNDLANSLALPSDPILAAAALLNGEIVGLDVVRARTADGVERLYAGGGGVGLDAEAARHANGTFRNLRGRMRYVLGAVRALFGFRPLHVQTIMTPGGPEPLLSTALVVAALNTPSYGGGVYLAPDAKTDDGKLELVLVEDLSLLQILLLLPALVLHGRLQTNRIRRFRVQYARIETDLPAWFHADGELLGLTPVEVSVVPNAVRVLRARTSAS